MPSLNPNHRPVLVVIGAGGMGLAVARRLGSGRFVVLADYSDKVLREAVVKLQDDGHQNDWEQITAMQVDVAKFESLQQVAAAAAAAADAGGSRVEAIVHTAGISGQGSTAARVFATNLLGTANCIDVFLNTPGAVGPGTAMVCVASVAGHWGRDMVPPATQQHFGKAPLDALLNKELAGLDFDAYETDQAYSISKRGVQLRVEASARAFGLRGARINSVSPGVIMTPMLREVTDGPIAAQRDFVRTLVDDSPAKRYGTVDDVAAAAAFLCGPEASFITGTDLLVDGGSAASNRWDRTEALAKLQTTMFMKK